jgi:hypothetical protein
VLILPVLGARELLRWAPTRSSLRLTRTAGLVGALLLAGGYLTFNVNGYRNRIWSMHAYAESIRPLLVHVGSRTSPDVLLATEAEGTVYLYTGRHTVPLGSFMASDYLKPRTALEQSKSIALLLEHYQPAAVVVSSPYLRAATAQLAAGDTPLLAVSDSFPGGGLVFVPVHR